MQAEHMQAVLVGHGSALYVGPTSDKSLLWVPPASQSFAQAPLAWPSSLEHCPRWRSCSVYNHTVIPKSGKEELWPLENTFPMFCSIRWHSKDPRDQGKEIIKGDDAPLEEHRLDTCAGRMSAQAAGAASAGPDDGQAGSTGPKEFIKSWAGNAGRQGTGKRVSGPRLTLGWTTGAQGWGTRGMLK